MLEVKRNSTITFDSWATLKAGKLGLNSGDKIPVTLKSGEEIELVYTVMKTETAIWCLITACLTNT
jgi:hypothetical protein